MKHSLAEAVHGREDPARVDDGAPTREAAIPVKFHLAKKNPRYNSCKIYMDFIYDIQK